MSASYQVGCFALFLLILTGCNITDSASQTEQQQTAQVGKNHSNIERLTMHKWRLISMQKYVIAKGEISKPITVTFDKTTQRVSGFAGCNNYFGTYTASEDKLGFSYLGMTRKMCRAGMKLEGLFSKTISLVASYKITDDKLMLFDKDENLIAELSKA